MKVVILAGGYGTRLSEETESRPKPMVDIGGMPMLWHVMKIYSHQGFNEFIICLGYKGYQIKEYFSNYFLHTSDVTFDMSSGQMQVHTRRTEPWKITLVDTGIDSMTGGRLKRALPYLQSEKTFMVTYGDGLSDINLRALIDFHKTKGLAATVTAVQPPGRFGSLQINESLCVVEFTEKPLGDGARINGGFFVFENEIFNRIAEDTTVLEQEPLRGLAQDRKLAAYQHNGFWQAMDTLRDKQHLEALWKTGKPPWKIW